MAFHAPVHVLTPSLNSPTPSEAALILDPISPRRTLRLPAQRTAKVWDPVPVRGLVVPFRAPGDNDQRLGQGGGRGSHTRGGGWEGGGKDQFCAPKGTQRTGRGWEAGSSRGSPDRGQGQAPARPRPPRRNLRSLPSSPRRAGRGASTKDSNFRAGARPPPTPGPGPAGRPEASCERRAARGERRWPRAGDPGGGGPGRRGAAQREGGRELRRLPGLPERPEKKSF